MMERWHIVNDEDGRILEVCKTARKARRAQRRWHVLSVSHDGPITTIRRVAIRDTTPDEWIHTG